MNAVSNSPTALFPSRYESDRNSIKSSPLDYLVKEWITSKRSRKFLSLSIYLYMLPIFQNRFCQKQRCELWTQSEVNQWLRARNQVTLVSIYLSHFSKQILTEAEMWTQSEANQSLWARNKVTPVSIYLSLHAPHFSKHILTEAEMWTQSEANQSL
jgi:hypothetical protein